MTKCSIGRKVLSCHQRMKSSNSSWLDNVDVVFLADAESVGVAFGTPPTGPGLMNGYPMTLSCSTLGIIERRWDHFGSRGDMKTNAGALGRLKKEVEQL